MFGPWGWKWKVGVPKNAEIRTILYRVSVDHQSLVVLLPGTVLSRTKPRKPPMNICVVKNMWSTWSNSLTPVITCHGQMKKKWKKRKNIQSLLWFTVPVWIKPGFFMIQLGMTNAENIEKPKMNMFLEEFMSVAWKMIYLSTLVSYHV